MPVLSSATGLVPCTNTPDATSGKVPNADRCDFYAFMVLLNKVINFLLFTLAVPIAAIMFAYAGFLMVTSGGSTESRSKAKSIFSNALIGFLLAAGAWIIVKGLLIAVGFKDIATFF
jgi:hypothetical protein